MPSRGLALSIAVAVGVVVLAVLVGCVMREGSGSSTRASEAALTSSPRIEFGFTAGTVVASADGVLVVQGIFGAQTRVRTTVDTKVVVLRGTRPADVKVGDAVLVHGDEAPDGSITANLILGGSLRLGLG